VKRTRTTTLSPGASNRIRPFFEYDNITRHDKVQNIGAYSEFEKEIVEELFEKEFEQLPFLRAES
jgi:hypothetical protein